jgi:XTP/dITP diphosphohydrolase
LNATKTTLLLATRNSHKVAEIKAILPENFLFLTLDDFPAAPKVIEDADSFIGNATKKSVALANWISGMENRELQSAIANERAFVLADDSGLEVDALNGAPGVYSARFAGVNGKENSPDAANNEKLLLLLEKISLEKRTARFRCVIALTPIVLQTNESQSSVCYADEAELRTEIFQGACEGKIPFAPSGKDGFGYDPLFIPNGFDKSFAELGEGEKNKISHRAKALQELRASKNLFR